MKAAYGIGPLQITVPSTSAPAARRAPRPVTDRMDKFGSYGQAVIDASLPLLPGENDAPLPTRELLAKLEFRGVDIRGENKVNALSALLARCSKIKGHGRAGWTLAGPKEAADQFDELLLKTEEPSNGAPVDGSETSSATLAEEARDGGTSLWVAGAATP